MYGSRFLTSSEHRVLYFWHYLGNRLLTLLSNLATDLNLTDMESCYKVFRRELLQSIVLEEDRFGFEPEITAKIAKGRGARLRSRDLVPRQDLRARQEDPPQRRGLGSVVHSQVRR